MNDAAQSKVLGGVRDGTAAAVRRRHVIYVSGYDPRGAQSFFELLRRTCERFGKLWPIAATPQIVDADSEAFARWQLDLRGADWQVATRYDFLRMENFIRADMAQPTLRQFFRALGWYADDVVSGAQFRIFRAAWRFALHLLYFQLLIVGWAAAAVPVAIVAGRIVGNLDLPPIASVIAALAAGTAALFALRPLAERWRVVQIASCWSTLRRFGRGRPTWIDHVVDVGAQHLVAAARTNEADEVALVGHSTGGAVACAIMARALELDPDLGRDGPRVVLLTLGSVMPAVALHPAAERMRGIVARLAVAPSIAWVDCQSRKDVMCFANFDPVEGIGIKQTSAARCNPLLWRISFKEMIAPEDYDRFRWSHFRVHYQYIMAGDRPAPYDYLLLVAGPMPVAEWPQRDREFFAAFRDATAAPVDHDQRQRDAKMVGAAP
jgi:pimeloyl-ACP methyl ester carboxylesterase